MINLKPQMNKIKYNSDTGITLIALVITTIVHYLWYDNICKTILQFMIGYVIICYINYF